MPDQAAAPAHRRINLRAILIGALVLVVIGAAATLFGWDVQSWLEKVWNTITGISIEYLIAALVLITLQTATTAFAWYSILRFAYPKSGLRWIEVFACYATAVALNFVLPANLGTLVMMLMFTTIIVAATFAGIVAGYVVQKIFYTTIGIATYVYLFLRVGDSFRLQFGFIEEHPWAFVLLLIAIAVLVYLVAQVMRPRLAHWWDQAKEGGGIIVQPRLYLRLVLLPEFVSWLAMLGIIGVFLAAYDIPVTFDTIIRVVAGNSIANMTAVTPGSAGVTQAFNALSLKGVTSSANATAYSVAQQLVSTAWSIVLAIVLMVRAFGWSAGRTLVSRSYAEARVKAAEEKAERRARWEARRERGAAGEQGAQEPQ
jgi:uncharacterized membrane protein YbhN (UPF0104 family)